MNIDCVKPTAAAASNAPGQETAYAEGHQCQPAEDARREEQIPEVNPSREAGKQKAPTIEPLPIAIISRL